MVETWFFLLFCGGAIQSGLSQIVGKQEAEYKERREADARRIAEQSIAEGDPGMAAGLFAVNAAGEVSKALSKVAFNSHCWRLISRRYLGLAPLMPMSYSSFR